SENTLKRNDLGVSEDTIKNAVANALRGAIPVRTTANTFGIKKSTLHARTKIVKQLGALSDSGNESSKEESYGLSKYATRRTWSTDETGISAIIQAPRVIAEIGKGAVGQCVSAERSTTVTVCGIISAAGGTIPPMYISTLWYKIGVDDHRNIRKIIGTHTKSHEKFSNMSNPINHARNNGTVLLSFPLHCMHKMQPLDKAVYGPYKQKCKISFNDYVLSKLTSKPFLQSLTPKNIISDFLRTGSWPIMIFTDEDFLGAYTTKRPDPEIKSELSPNMSLITVMDKTSDSSDTNIFDHNDFNNL
ncbi:hypothetical protein ILUMI_07825, partial [Ignelater luminosus]